MGTVSERPSWMDAPIAVTASVIDDLKGRVRTLDQEHFPMDRKSLLLFLDTIRPHGGP